MKLEGHVLELLQHCVVATPHGGTSHTSIEESILHPPIFLTTRDGRISAGIRIQKGAIRWSSCLVGKAINRCCVLPAVHACQVYYGRVAEFQR